MTVNEILNTYHVLDKLSSNEFDLNTSCKIAKNIQELDTYIKVIDSKRNSIIEKYSTKNEDGTYTIDNNVDEINSHINELLYENIDVNIVKIKEEAFKELKISPADAMWLMNIIE